MDINAIQGQTNCWLTEKLKLLGCSDIDDLTHEMCKAPLKDRIAGILHSALLFINKQSECVESLKNDVSKLRVDLIESQRSVVKLQDQLLNEKDVQGQAIKQTVSSSVQESIKQEFRSYSEVAAAHTEASASQSVSITPETLKSVVKSVVESEDRSRNVMLFGVSEEEDEQLSDKVRDIFQCLGEKPRFDAVRVGRKGTVIRPVKVLFKNIDSVKQIISKARSLRVTEEYKNVFVSPDRCLEDRLKQRQLVQEMKRLNSENPDLRHIIRDGRLITVDKK